MVEETKDSYSSEDTQEIPIVTEEDDSEEVSIEIPIVEPNDEVELIRNEPEDDVVAQVLRGEWGVGQDRRLRLHKAGYDPKVIESEIVRIKNQR